MVFLFSLIFITLSTVNAVSASSSVIYVNGSHGNDANDGLTWATAKLTIKNATGTVSAGGTVNIANGIYIGENNTNIRINKSISIKGQSKSHTIINGSNNAQIFKIEKTSTLEDINVIIQNLTIINGNATHGGAIHNNGTLTIKDCILSGNRGTNGGAIYNSGTLTVENSYFTSNQAYGDGGAIYNTGTSAIKNSYFTSNIANCYYGGAIYNTGTLNITSSTFKNNCGNTGDFYGSGATIYNANILNISYSSLDRQKYEGINPSIRNKKGIVNAGLNWWGTNNGPGSYIDGFTVNKWLVLTINANPSSVLINTNSKITADLRYDNTGVLHTEAYLPNGIPVTFATNLGTISPKAYTVNGITQATLKSATGGTANVSVIADSQRLYKSVKIIDYIPPKVILTYPKNGATGVSRTNTIIIKFSENIKASYNWPKIYVKNLNTGRIVSISKSISGNKLYIKMNAKRYAYTWYRVYIPKAAVKDYSSNKLATYYTFKFKTGKYPLTYE